MPGVVFLMNSVSWGLPWWLSDKLLASGGAVGLIPGLERSPGGNGHLFQSSCLGNPMNRGAQRAVVRGVAKESDTT